MLQKDTEKYHKVIEDGTIIEEKFTSTLRLFGIKIHGGKHSYTREGDVTKEKENGLGFKKPATR